MPIRFIPSSTRLLADPAKKREPERQFSPSPLWGGVGEGPSTSIIA